MVPQRTICSQVSGTKGEGTAPASFENRLLCRSSVRSQQFTTHFRAAAVDIELFFPSEDVSQCAGNIWQESYPAGYITS